MNRCMTDGDLRAFADGELPAGAPHLGECADCRDRLRRIEARAHRVGAMIAELEAELPHRFPARVQRRRSAAAGVFAAAATVLLAFILSRPSPAPPPPAAGFLPLDDADPFQMGIVVRVVLPQSAAGALQADVLVGEDGRPRAVRLVN